MFGKYTKNIRVIKVQSESESVHSSLDNKSVSMFSMFLTISLSSSSSLEGTRVNEAAIDVSSTLLRFLCVG